MKPIVIKQNGYRASEQFNDNKLKGSVYAACLSVRTPEGEAQRIADDVLRHTKKWCKDHPEVTSLDLRHIATKHLQIFQPEAAYLYRQLNSIL